LSFVIFDLDGTLIESEQIWRDVRRDFVRQHGGNWVNDAQNKMIGMRTEEWSRYIHDDLGVAVPPNEIAHEVVAGVIERLSAGVPILPGADVALQRLSSDFPLGLATSATLAVARAALEKTGWEKYFKVVVSADQVAYGKPAPDVYLRTLSLLNANSASTVAIEDSANGVRSANAAHLAVIVIPNREFPPDSAALSLASRVLSSLTELTAKTIQSLVSP
jgi:HAD superfamily hydrolase (TIGR01509 family)